MKRSLMLCLLTSCLFASRSAHAQFDDVRDTHRTLQLTTSGGLILTSTLGIINAINQPTLFSEGRCASGRPIFGEYGCKGLGPLHGLFALLTVVLYTSTEALEFSRFDWPGRDRHGDGFTALSYVHLIGMIIQPIGGLIAGVPQLVGASPNGVLPKVLRTLHLFTGFAITGAFIATTAWEL